MGPNEVLFGWEKNTDLNVTKLQGTLSINWFRTSSAHEENVHREFTYRESHPMGDLLQVEFLSYCCARFATRTTK